MYDEHASSVQKMQQTSRRYNDMMRSNKKNTLRDKHVRWVFMIGESI